MKRRVEWVYVSCERRGYVIRRTLCYCSKSYLHEVEVILGFKEISIASSK